MSTVVRQDCATHTARVPHRPVLFSFSWVFLPFLVLLFAWPPAVQAAVRITSIAPSCVNVGEQVVLTGSGFGAQNVTVKVNTLTATVISATGNRVTFLVPTGVTPGVATVTATNPGGQSGSIALRIRNAVEICANGIDDNCNNIIDDPASCSTTNHPPVSNAGADQTSPVGSTLQLTGTGSSDPDGNALSYQWTVLSKPSGSTVALVNPITATPSLTLDKAGAYTVQLTVSDGSLSSTDTVVLSTSNSSPVANAGPDQTGQVGLTIALDGSNSSDVDGNALTYQWSLFSAPTGSTAALVDPTSVTPTLTLDAFGPYVVQLVVNDGAVNSAPDTLTINTLNSPPTANAGPDQSGHVGETIVLDGTASHDPDANALIYQWSLVGKPSGSTAALQNPSTAQPGLTIDKAGTYVAQLVVNDGLVNSAPDSATISTLNSKPVAKTGADQSATIGTTITLDGSGSSDVDGNPLTYHWSITTKPVGSVATLSNPTSLTPSFVIDKPGTYVVQLIVHDGTAPSEPGTITVSTLNSKPVAHAGTDQHGTVGTTITLNGSGSSDVDGDLLTYTWSIIATPAGSTATLSDPAAVEPSFVLDKPGTYTVQLTVNDGLVDSDAVTVTISTVNSRPSARPGPDQHGVVGTTITLNGSASSDVDGDVLTYQWSLTSKPTGSTATLQSATSVSSSFVLDKPGTYIAQLIVNDGHLDSEPVTVTITTLNSKPVANAGPDQEALAGQIVHLTGSGSHDADGDSLSFFWSLTVIPTGSSTDVVDPNSLTPSFVPDVAGTYVVQLIVNDGHLDSEPDTTTVTITVPPDNTPPTPADLSKITVSGITNGQVTVTGAAGSVESRAQVKITNTRTSQLVTVTAGADGSFSVQVAAQAGDTLSITMRDAAENTSPARTVQVVAAVQVAITSPVQGAFIALNRTRVTGTVQGPAYTRVVVNGLTALVYNGTFVVDNVPLVTGSNTLTVTATTVNGQTATATVTVSSQGVAPVVTFQATPNGGIAPLHAIFSYTYTGTNPIARLQVAFTGNGTFNFSTTNPNWPLDWIYPVGSYVVRLRVTDTQGNFYDTDTTIVALPPDLSDGISGVSPQIAITSPGEGTFIATDRTRVMGTVQGPANTGVVVNGIVAMVQNGFFVADNVPLVAGENTITAVATSLGGQNTQAHVTVTGQGFAPVVTLTATPNGGLATMHAFFSYTYTGPYPIARLQVDFTGDGRFDFSTTDPNWPLDWNYLAGIYVVRLRVTDTQGYFFDAETTIVVQDPSSMNALFTSMWNGMNAVLVSGDITTALLFLDSAAQEKYGRVWQALLPHMAEIVASYSPIRALAISNSIGEYGLNRTINGEKRLFLIYFLKNEDGVWRLNAM